MPLEIPGGWGGGNPLLVSNVGTKLLISEGLSLKIRCIAFPGKDNLAFQQLFAAACQPYK